MASRKRRITSAILLASYLLASVAVWIHMAHECGIGCQPGVLLDADSNHAYCPTHDHGDTAHHTQPSPSSLAQMQREGPSPTPQHQHDDCALCRFQLTKKLVEYVPTAISFSTVYPEQIALDAPRQRVAQILATPDSRAPPHRA